jgi:hypothetical protein
VATLSPFSAAIITARSPANSAMPVPNRARRTRAARGYIRVSGGRFRQRLAVAPIYGETPEWTFWAVLGFLALMMLLSALKR